MHLVSIAVNASENEVVADQYLDILTFGIRHSVTHPSFGLLLRNSISVYNYKH